MCTKGLNAQLELRSHCLVVRDSILDPCHLLSQLRLPERINCATGKQASWASRRLRLTRSEVAVNTGNRLVINLSTGLSCLVQVTVVGYALDVLTDSRRNTLL